ncbi:TPA: fimbrial biogenesis outer membrane usher protein [Klebsiella oxytoca]|nr:fimbrial biogenesis outer membrane usher protein [Klebsiella oxytoca]
MLMTLPPFVGAELYFPSFLVSQDEDAVADLSHLTPAGAQLPGNYDVELYLNGTWLAERKLKFVPVDSLESSHAALPPGGDVHDDTGLVACLTPGDWHDLGIRTDAVPAMGGIPETECVSPGRYIPQAYTSWDFDERRLDISIPQAMLKSRPRGWIPPERWDEGVNALMLGYRFNGSNSHDTYSNNRNLYLNLNSGINVGPWRLRDNRTWSSYSTSGDSTRKNWERLNTYLERAIIPWRSQLLIGEASTEGDLFDSFSFRGAKLSTDDSMYPDTMRGFAPVVRGTAASNARISIRQNGSQVYQAFVPPGEFVVDDLYPVSTGGDLEVTVTEADGASRTFIVPYASVPLLQREGRVRWNVAAGRYRSNSNSYGDPEFAQGTLQWGLPFNVTVYGGLQMSEKYQAGMLGSGMNMGGWGAVSADITHAESKLADDTHHEGQSLRFLYSRALSSLGTTLNLTGYRYSTNGFHTLDETALKGMKGWLYDYDKVDSEGRLVKRPYTDYYNLYNTKRSRIQASVSQKIRESGSIYLNGNRQTFWNNSSSTDSLMIGYSDMIGPVNYSLSWSYSKASNQAGADRMAYLSFSLPFSALMPGASGERQVARTRLTGSVSRNGDGRSSYMVGMNGSMLEDHNLNWNILQGYERQGHNSNSNEGSGNANVNYRGTYGEAQAGYSYGRDYKQVSYGLSGGAVLHRNGLTLGQQPGTTSVLVAVPGAADVPVMNGTGVRTDWRGYALLPYSSAYRENRVELDTRHLDERTELDETATRVVPTRGALVRADFKARSGIRALVTLKHKGKPLPFGTTITDMEGNSSIAGDSGEVYLSGLKKTGVLKARWGINDNQKCTVHYRLSESQTKLSLAHFSEVCE